MGRAKRSLELLSNHKERCRTFERRMVGLKKKAHELKTLCGLEVCLIVDNIPKAIKGNHQIEVPQIWPSDPNLIKKLITSHRNQCADKDPKLTVDLSTFLEEQKKKENKKKENEMYPSWDDRYNVLSKEQLEQFGGLLEQKLHELKTRIEVMKYNSSINSARLLKEPRDGDYYQKQIAASELYFRLENGNTGVYFKNPMPDLSIENDFSDYNQNEEFKTRIEVMGYNSSINNAHLLEEPRDSNYYQKQIAAQSELFFPENGNSCVYFGNPVPDLLMEKDLCYAQLEDLYSSDFLRSLMDDDSALSVANAQGYFDSDTQVVSQYSQDPKAGNASLGRTFSVDLDEFCYGEY